MVATIVFDIEDLRNYAARAGVGLNFVVKEAFLFELMDSVGSEKFVLKGGTAINKGYLKSHQRFSEDLDYDTRYGKEEAREYIRALGWAIKKEFFTKNSIGFMMQYSLNGIKDVVRLDISFGIKNTAERHRVESDFIPISKVVLMYTFEELNRQKEAAFEERTEWKDLYDLYWMSELYKSRFGIKDKTAFSNALLKTRVPKTANAYVPIQKRPNWGVLIEELQHIIKG